MDQLPDKLDSNFSRSRSSSMSSLDNITSEAIQCLTFVDSFSKKGETIAYPTLWVGTSLGSIISIAVNLPMGGKEARKMENVSVNPTGTIFRLKGSMLCMAFLDCNGNPLPTTYEAWRDEAKERSKTPTKGLSTGSRQSPTQLSLDSSGSLGGGDKHFVILVSEKQSRVLTLPSQTCLYKQQLCENSFVIKAEVTTVKDSPCLVCYVSNGHLMILSIPSLRQLMDVDFVPLADLSFHQTRKSGIVDPMLSIWGQQMIVNEDTNS
ncbi:unnamed protein product [Orchesella dallaii]|uniref:Lethal giant larvae (Lgl)-like C-terminal domain-containing protein n=1 Tax=Orchesella dallaii TaxID=48710 RepID=A0ABP1QRV2_9HEXA